MYLWYIVICEHMHVCERGLFMSMQNWCCCRVSNSSIDLYLIAVIIVDKYLIEFHNKQFS